MKMLGRPMLLAAVSAWLMLELATASLFHKNRTPEESVCNYMTQTEADAIPTLVNRLEDEMDKTTHLSFSVKACQNVYIFLGDENYLKANQTQDRNQTSLYTIEIGADVLGDSISYIWNNYTKRAQYKHPENKQPLRCDKFTRFYIRWQNSEIEVGYETPHEGRDLHVAQKSFLRYKPDKPFLPFKYVSVTGKTQADWHFDIPCPHKASLQTKTMTVTHSQERYTLDKYASLRVDIEADELTRVIPPGDLSVSEMKRFIVSMPKCSEARIILTRNATPTENVIEVTFGKSEVYLQVKVKAEYGAPTAEPHTISEKDCHGYRKLYVDWSPSLVTVGYLEVSPKNPRRFQDVPLAVQAWSPSFLVDAILVSGTGSPNTLFFDFQQDRNVMVFIDEYKEVTTTRVKKYITMERSVDRSRCAWLSRNQGNADFKRCYYLSERNFTFQESNDYCQRYGGHVAVFDLMQNNTDLARTLTKFFGGKMETYEDKPQDINVTVIESEPVLLEDFSFTEQRNTLIFSVKIMKGARIVISKDKNYINDTLHFIIGGWAGRKTVAIVKVQEWEKHVVLAKQDFQVPLNNQTFRDFWITAKNGMISVGEGLEPGKRLVVEAEDKDQSSNAPDAYGDYVFLTSALKQSGKYIVKKQQFKDSQPNPPKKPLTTFWGQNGVHSLTKHCQTCYSTQTEATEQSQDMAKMCMRVQYQGENRPFVYVPDRCDKRVPALCEIPYVRPHTPRD